MSTIKSETLPAAEHRTVARVMSILELVLARDPEGVQLAELSSAIDAPKSSVHGLARGLVATGYFREERGRYFAGPAISTLIAAGPTVLSSVYHHALERLTATWKETTMLATLVGDSLVYLDSVESESLIRAAPRLNQRMSLWPRSAGKCFLAFMEPKRRDAYLRRSGLANVAEVRAELDVVRENRIGVNIGQTIGDHIALASPIDIGNGSVTMAIVIAGPRSRMENNVDAIAASLRDVVASVTTRHR